MITESKVRVLGGKKFRDDQLELLARSFADLPEFEWTAGPFGDGFSSGGRADEVFNTDKKSRHIQNVPHSDIFCVRFVLRKAHVYVAYSRHDRLDDLMRYADVMTLRLQPYRLRGKYNWSDSLFNFGRKSAELDLEVWTETRPDITDLQIQTIQRLEELDLIALPEQLAERNYRAGVHSLSRTRSVAGKVESVLAYNQELTETLLGEKLLAIQNLFVGVDKRLERLEKKLDDALAARRSVDLTGRPDFDSTAG